jgi:hypothetical protein
MLRCAGKSGTGNRIRLIFKRTVRAAWMETPAAGRW